MTIDIARLVPKFILADRNGYALAKALEAAMRIIDATVDQGIKCVTDVSAMPEWRLDEMAWEYACLYDNTAPVEVKRQWIRDAVPMYSIYGTKAGVIQYLRPYFESVELNETGNFAFEVSLFGDLSPENEAWARKAIALAKNVRSVLTSALHVSEEGDIDLTDSEALWWAYERRPCGSFRCGADII